ncbi:hypothetical protein FOL47_001328, partial [Perkinsus chesapeaki]
VASQHGWTIALKYDEAVRSRWATKSLFGDTFNLQAEAAHVDLESLLMVKGAAEKAARSEPGRICFGFSKAGPEGCRRKNCTFIHRCGICRSFKHGTSQHKKGDSGPKNPVDNKESAVNLTANKNKANPPGNAKHNA